MKIYINSMGLKLWNLDRIKERKKNVNIKNR